MRTYLQKKIRSSISSIDLTCKNCGKKWVVRNLVFYHKNYDQFSREVAFICRNEKCKLINILHDDNISEFWREISHYGKAVYSCYQYPTSTITI